MTCLLPPWDADKCQNENCTPSKKKKKTGALLQLVLEMIKI